MKSRHLSYWLIPTVEHCSVLQTVINKLASRFDVSPFPPHLTIFAGPLAAEDEPLLLLESLPPDLVPQELEVNQVEVSDRFTMTLFLRCQNESKLVSLHEYVRANSPSSNYCLDPHLSLLYADIPLATKESLADEFESPLKKIQFDRIRAVSHLSPVQTQEDIDNFQDIGEVLFQPKQ
ncbi:MAG: hypothetical protein CMI31_04935 [Opitutae bacterium]|nr:hypothetical protein [Opitutae bacterium]